MMLAALVAACGSGRENPIASSNDPAVFYAHSVAFRDAGLFAWGANSYGQLGSGDQNNSDTRYLPVQVTGAAATGMSGVSAGGTHILAFNTTPGNVYAWGNNGFGQLGNGSTSANATPVLVLDASSTALTGVTAVSAGASHSLAISNQNVWTWGSNSEGQLGVDTATPFRITAAQITALSTVDKIAAGGAHSLALSNGQVQSWGSNTAGQLGFVTTSTSIPTPGTVVKAADSLPLSPVTDIAAGGSHSLFIAAGAVWACGLNIFGQLGVGDTTDRKAGAVQVNLTGVSGVPDKVAAGLDHSLVLMSDGTVWGWGLNNYGQLGNGGTLNDITPVTAPVQVLRNTDQLPLIGIVKIAVIGYHNLAVDNLGQLWVWGYNAFGQLGLADNDTFDRNYATQVPGFAANSSL
jgi:alpha-tubulin suppressor-like RCC1 family protein